MRSLAFVVQEAARPKEKVDRRYPSQIKDIVRDNGCVSGITN